jgi:hypothetical protein
MGGLFDEKGSDGDIGDNMERLTALIQERMTKYGETWGQASEQVMKDNPELYIEYNEENVKAGDSVELSSGETTIIQA